MLNRLLRGVGALIVLAVLLVGAPWALLAWVGNPWPPGGWAEVQLLTGRTIFGLIALIGWIAWAQMTACIVTEGVAAVRSISTRGLAATLNRRPSEGQLKFAPAKQQQFARALITSVVALGFGASAMATTAPAMAATPSAGHATHTATAAETDHARGHQQESAAASRRSITPSAPSTLWRLAETHLGDGGKWRQILQANADTTLADGTQLTSGTQTIPAGSTIYLPAGAHTTVQRHDDSRTGAEEQEYTVRTGDNLTEIARSHGEGDRWQPLYEANKKVIGDNPNLIYRGEKLKLPAAGGANTNHPAARTAPSGTAVPHAQPQTKPDAKPAPTPQPASQQAPGQVAPPAAKADPQPTPQAAPHTGAPETTQGHTGGQQRPASEPSPSAAPTAPASTPAPASAPHHADAPAARASSESGSILSAPWVLPGLTGGGVLLAGALYLGVGERRRKQFRARRPGRAIAGPDPELAPVERTITAAGGPASERVALLHEVLRRLAAAAHATNTPMPPLAAVELGADQLRLHLSQAADLPQPWDGTPDRMHWECPIDIDVSDVGPETGNVDTPYPLLVTVGQHEEGSIWLLNVEEMGTIRVSGAAERGRDFARHIAAQLAVNPWSNSVHIDCIGVAEEAVGLGPEVRYHPGGEEADAAVAGLFSESMATVERANELHSDVTTGRTGQIDEEAWPARMLLVDAAAEEPEHLQDLVKLVADQRGRTGTAILLTGQQEDEQPSIDGFEVEVTPTGRVLIASAGLDLAAVSLTSQETEGCAQVYAQREVLDDVPVPVDDTATEGWEAYADKAGALRAEHTLPRDTEVDEDGEEPATLLEAPDDDYVREAPVLREDLAAVAPKVSAKVRAEIEEEHESLDADVSDWFSRDCPRPRLSVLGPVTVRTRGKALTERIEYFGEFLTYLALHRRNGATRAELEDAFGIKPADVRNYVKDVRAWLGTDPATGERYLPDSRVAPAAKLRGTPVYQVSEGLLFDLDLFRRLRHRGETRGGQAGLQDLATALELVTGVPFSQRHRRGGFNWMDTGAGEREDEYATIAIADVAFTVTTEHLKNGDLAAARSAAELAVFAAPHEEATRLCLVKIQEAEGDRRAAERTLREGICDRTDDDGPPPDLNDRTKAIIDNHGWLDTRAG